MCTNHQDTQDPETAVIDIATQLDEPASHVVNQIQRIIEQVGVAAAYLFCRG